MRRANQDKSAKANRLHKPVLAGRLLDGCVGAWVVVVVAAVVVMVVEIVVVLGRVVALSWLSIN